MNPTVANFKWTDVGTITNRCVVEACAQATYVWTGVAPTDAQVDQAQNEFSGSAEDIKALEGFCDRGVCGTKAFGYALISTDAQIKQAIDMSGCAMLGMAMFEGVGPHMVLAISYTPEFVNVVSWGAVYSLSWADHAANKNSSYALFRSFDWHWIWWNMLYNRYVWAGMAFVPAVAAAAWKFWSMFG